MGVLSHTTTEVEAVAVVVEAAIVMAVDHDDLVATFARTWRMNGRCLDVLHRLVTVATFGARIPAS